MTKMCTGTPSFCTESTQRSKSLQKGNREGKRCRAAEREGGAELAGVIVCGAGGRDLTAPGPHARVCTERGSGMVPPALF